MTDPTIRRFRASDIDALYDICVRTGAAGADASALVDDQRLFGEIWAAPYALFEPEHAYVIDTGRPTGTPGSPGPDVGQVDDGVVGYILGTIDAVAFEDRCEREWWPGLRQRYPLTDGGERLDDLLISLIHHRPEPRSDLAGRYPSELHIDMLPVVQGHGWGRRLVDTLLDGLRAAGSPGVHLGVSVANTNAIAFYRHLGFDEFDSDGMTTTFVMDL